MDFGVSDKLLKKHNIITGPINSNDLESLVFHSILLSEAITAMIPNNHGIYLLVENQRGYLMNLNGSLSVITIHVDDGEVIDNILTVSDEETGTDLILNFPDGEPKEFEIVTVDHTSDLTFTFKRKKWIN